MILKNHGSVAIKKGRLRPWNKQGERRAEISLCKRAGCQTESKVIEKSMVARIVQYPSEIDEKNKEFDGESIGWSENRPGDERKWR